MTNSDWDIDREHSLKEGDREGGQLDLCQPSLTSSTEWDQGLLVNNKDKPDFDRLSDSTRSMEGTRPIKTACGSWDQAGYYYGIFKILYSSSCAFNRKRKWNPYLNFKSMIHFVSCAYFLIDHGYFNWFTSLAKPWKIRYRHFESSAQMNEFFSLQQKKDYIEV